MFTIVWSGKATSEENQDILVCKKMLSAVSDNSNCCMSRKNLLDGGRLKMFSRHCGNHASWKYVSRQYLWTLVCGNVFSLLALSNPDWKLVAISTWPLRPLTKAAAAKGYYPVLLKNLRPFTPFWASTKTRSFIMQYGKWICKREW